MFVCHTCGKANPVGCLYCQDCGTRATELERKAGGSGPACRRCRSVNEPGMSFCKMCGASLSPGGLTEAPPYRPVGASAAEVPAMVGCPTCGRPTQAGLAYCQLCGNRMVPRAGSASTSQPSLALVPSNGVVHKLTVLDYLGGESAGRRPAPSEAAVLYPAGSPISVGSSNGSHGSEHPSRAPVAAIAAARPEPRALPGGTARGRLVLVADGHDQQAHVVASEPFDIGRSEGSMVISADPLLAPRHARVLLTGGVLKVRPLDTVNGVFIKLREATELLPGDSLLLGRQLLRFEAVGPDESDPPSLSQHGVRLLGSAVRKAWGRLRQLTTAGTTRDVWHLTSEEVTVGGAGSDVVLGDDDDILPHHLLLQHAGGRARVEDTGSSLGGTFLRLRGDRELRHGDLLKMGDQLVRFENAG